ncbi:MAG: hypothetical protein DI626_08210 [Micavibrio aeruginosavorus]|uniref:Uncharacterized protein n=1 Tax=Micavibrio aeruginosavorus TaxID=349221 RepID=A0A2W4ZQ91_9BACT|nr:MAG: hypothetical protein DI626_08210 [Micavibrio aeruginosavorus]
MNWKTILLRLAGLIVISFLGGTLFAVCVNAFVYFGAMPGNLPDGTGYGAYLTQNAAFVWMGAIAAGIISLFIRQSWRLAFYFAPLYAPSLYAVSNILANS